MKIPILNLYFLLLYAWDRLEEKEVVDVNTEGITELVDLFGRVLANGVTHLIKHGIDRGYRSHEQNISGIRGKLELGPTIKQNLLIRRQTHCTFDDLSFDILHNQLLKTTLRNLIRAEGIDADLREGIADLYRRLEGISEIDITNRAFRLVQLHRNNRLYDFLLKVCQLIHANLLINQTTGKAKFRDFTRDDKEMATLFQRFVFNFYKREQKEFSVRSLQINWSGTAGNEVALAYLPSMQTDIVLRSKFRTVVIDTKYYLEAFQHYYGVKKVRSDHLYQILAYLQNLAPALAPDHLLEGMLLYPAISGDFALQYELLGYPVTVRSINLNQPWHQIHEDLLQIVIGALVA